MCEGVVEHPILRGPTSLAAPRLIDALPVLCSKSVGRPDSSRCRHFKACQRCGEVRNRTRRPDYRLVETTYTLSARINNGAANEDSFLMKREIAISNLALAVTYFQSSPKRPRPPKASAINLVGPMFFSKTLRIEANDQ